jgi:hypothetical protein
MRVIFVGYQGERSWLRDQHRFDLTLSRRKLLESASRCVLEHLGASVWGPVVRWIDDTEPRLDPHEVVVGLLATLQHLNPTKYLRKFPVDQTVFINVL